MALLLLVNYDLIALGDIWEENIKAFFFLLNFTALKLLDELLCWYLASPTSLFIMYYKADLLKYNV